MEFVVERCSEQERGLLCLRYGGSEVVALTGDGGTSTVLLEDDAVVGRVAYGPDRPASQALVPRTVDPGSEVLLSLRGDDGRVWQERSSVLFPRRRALTLELAGQRHTVWQARGRVRLAGADGAVLVELDVRTGAGAATVEGGQAARVVEALFLLLAGTVTRHLSSLTM